MPIGILESGITIGIFVLIIITLVDILKSDAETSSKLPWILVTILMPVLGSVIYFVVKRQ